STISDYITTVYYLMQRPPPISTLFPYTTLFRSPAGNSMAQMALRFILNNPDVSTIIPGMRKPRNVEANIAASDQGPLPAALHKRSEEHTSELQSPYDLVCRLLLEKKKTNTHTHK